MPPPWRWVIAPLAAWLSTGGALAAEGSPWFDGARPTSQARQAVELLSAAAGHGLEPQDYDADALSRSVVGAAQGDALPPSAIARVEQALTVSVERYLTHLHRGRVDPRRIYREFAAAPPDTFDAATALRNAFAAGRLHDAVRDAAPRLPLYERLREALARYRELAATTLAWREPLPPLPGALRGRAGTLEPGQAYSGVSLLGQRLAALGDLDSAALPAVRSDYEAPLVDAIVGFQKRHGLTADGVIGKATLAQLQVEPRTRVRQIELALERLRWTPLLAAPRMIVINIPEFVLRAYEVDAEGRISVRHEMRVIVGKALDTRTPLLVEAMRFIEFSPYWNVPASIARAEVVPRLRRDPGFFDREGFEFVGADGSIGAALSESSLDALLAGRLRIRQRPGPQNPLGDIKFVFPNREQIYLHHTPQDRLFERDRRDFSHGCIRVEQPVELASFVLQGIPGWTPERIVHAMGGGKPSTLRLPESVPVLVTYTTALVKNGKLHFFPDLYGHDRTLDTWLRTNGAR